MLSIQTWLRRLSFTILVGVHLELLIQVRLLHSCNAIHQQADILPQGLGKFWGDLQGFLNSWWKYVVPSLKLTIAPARLRHPKGNEKVFQPSIFSCENVSSMECFMKSKVLRIPQLLIVYINRPSSLHFQWGEVVWFSVNAKIYNRFYRKIMNIMECIWKPGFCLQNSPSFFMKTYVFLWLPPWLRHAQGLLPKVAYRGSLLEIAGSHQRVVVGGIYLEDHPI